MQHIVCICDIDAYEQKGLHFNESIYNFLILFLFRFKSNNTTFNYTSGTAILDATFLFQFPPHRFVIWSCAFSENVDMQDGELTKKGFIELNQMEADDNEGDVEDLWVTLNFMGYNKLLELDEVSASLLVKPHLIINIFIIFNMQCTFYVK